METVLTKRASAARLDQFKKEDHAARTGRTERRDVRGLTVDDCLRRYVPSAVDPGPSAKLAGRMLQKSCTAGRLLRQGRLVPTLRRVGCHRFSEDEQTHSNSQSAALSIAEFRGRSSGKMT